MKILALDLGEKWVGSAISDGLGISCKPYQTISYIKPQAIWQFLAQVIKLEGIETIIIGNPISNQGLETDQTKKNKILGELLKVETEKILKKELTWIFWDERLSSKRAQGLQQGKVKTKEVKVQEHSLAAAFILQTYLDHKAFAASL